MHRTVASLWIGSELTALEQVCIQSFMDHEHQFILYSYEPVENAPRGTELRDAREIFDSDRILRYAKNGSPALHADLFRYALCSKTDFIWVDVDVLALRPLLAPTDYIFGFQGAGSVNNAVLSLPKSSAALKELIKYNVNTTGFPPSLGDKRKLERWFKSLLGPRHISKWPWGSTGPKLLTHHSQKTGEIVHAKPVEVFYPVPFSETKSILMPNALKFEDFDENSLTVHLWAKRLREILKDDYADQIPPNSFLDLAMHRHPFKLA